MINETYVVKLVALVKAGIVKVEDIKVEEYKLEVQKRLAPATT